MCAEQDPKEFQLHFCVSLIAVFSGNLQPDVTISARDVKTHGGQTRSTSHLSQRGFFARAVPSNAQFGLFIQRSLSFSAHDSLNFNRQPSPNYSWLRYRIENTFISLYSWRDERRRKFFSIEIYFYDQNDIKDPRDDKRGRYQKYFCSILPFRCPRPPNFCVRNVWVQKSSR